MILLETEEVRKSKFVETFLTFPKLGLLQLIYVSYIVTLKCNTTYVGFSWKFEPVLVSLSASTEGVFG